VEHKEFNSYTSTLQARAPDANVPTAVLSHGNKSHATPQITDNPQVLVASNNNA